MEGFLNISRRGKVQKIDVNPFFLQHPREVKGRQREQQFSLAVKKTLFPYELLTKRFREKKRKKGHLYSEEKREKPLKT